MVMFFESETFHMIQSQMQHVKTSVWVNLPNRSQKPSEGEWFLFNQYSKREREK